MNPKIKAIRKIIRNIRSKCKSKTERAIRLRMTMDTFREVLYGKYYNFEYYENKFIDFLMIFISLSAVVGAIRGPFIYNQFSVSIVLLIAISYKKWSILKSMGLRVKKDYLKTNRALRVVKKSELRKLRADAQDWYMTKRDYLDSLS